MQRLTKVLSTAFYGISACLISVSSFAMSAQQIVEKETVIITPDGAEQIVRSSANGMLPGDRLVYRLIYTNDGAEPANDLVLTMPVPAEVEFLAGTETQDNMTITYSTDGGKSFAVRESVTVRSANGETRLASASDITHIRWTIPGPVSIGETGELSFSGTLK